MRHLRTVILFFALLINLNQVIIAQNELAECNAIEITNVEYYAGTTRIKITKNIDRNVKAKLVIDYFATEKSDLIKYNKTITLNHKHEVIILEDLFFSKALIKIFTSSGKQIAFEEFIEGDWKIKNPSEHFTFGFYPEDRYQSPNCTIIERSIIVVPRLLYPSKISKSINKKINDSNQLSFFSEHLEDISIMLECSDGFYEYHINGLEDGKQSIPLKDFENEFGENFFDSEITNIHLELKGDAQGIPIKLKHLQFDKPNTLSMLQDDPKRNNKMYPNPSNGNLTIQMKQTGLYRLEIFNPQQQFYLKYLEIDGPTQVDLSHLSTGTYFYRISNEEEEWVEKLLIKRL